MENLPALSVRQPWASAIVEGSKRIENRTWPTKYRGRFYIHAAKTVTTVGVIAYMNFLAYRRINSPLCYDHWKKLPYGGIIGEAEIVDCVEESDSPWFTGKYGFVLANVRPLALIPMNGRQGFFYPFK